MTATPTVPTPSPLEAMRIVLRGISQVFLQRNALSGLVILIGLALASWHTAVLALLGAVVQTLAGWWTGRQSEARDGLMGFNGALVGAAASLDLGGLLPAALLTVVGAAACVPVHAAFERLLGQPGLRRHALPVATAPFCAVAGSLLVVVQRLAPDAAPLSTTDEPLRAAVLGVLNGAAEVFLADGPVTGVIVLVALTIASPRVAVWAAGGAALAVAGGWLEQAGAETVSRGLLEYSAVLVAIALGATFRTGRSIVWRVAVVALGVFLAMLLQWLLGHTRVPVYTWPFVLTTWVLLAVTRDRPAQ